MPAFLDKLTQHIYQTHKDHLGDICIVLPNRRAALFIRKYLAGLIQRTSFLPGFYSIEDFVTETSGQILADPLGLQFSMYDLHRQIQAGDVRSIEEFLPYANWMLSDFNEVDMYLARPSQLFRYLGDIKSMSLWNPDGRPLNDFEKRYLAFIKSIGDYYHGLRDMLGKEGLAYQGMAFRQLADNIETAAARMRWYRVIFAGFNALTPAEEKITGHLLNNGMAEVYWDADRYYTKDPQQEAGEFLRRYFRDLNRGAIMWEEDNFMEPKQIKVVGVPKNAGQVKYAGEILEKLFREKGSLDKTAVVLPDEGLLIPLLNSIPLSAGEFNVTMGLALKDTQLFALFDNILNMHENAERIMGLKDSAEKLYYTRDLNRIFNHPWFRLMEKHAEGAPDILKKVRESNSVFLSYNKILSYINTEHALAMDPSILFPTCHGAVSMLSTFEALINKLRQLMTEKRIEEERKYTLELEYLYHFSILLQRLDDLIKKHESISALKTFHLIFRQMAGQQRIPFYGEPLKGLQVMGMLETRTLDFDTLIMLSANEGILPSARSHNSFIPHDIRQTFGLPTYHHNNKVFAYHFYRLLQRAKEIYLLYNTEAGQLGGEEKSRYITQLLHESNKYNPDIEISEKVLSMPPAAGRRDTSIIIEKGKDVLSLLRKEAERGFHPSSLSLYINCPLQFYLGRLLRIEESEESEETIDNRVMGIVMHETLRSLMEDHLNRPIDKVTLTALKKRAKRELALQFSREMHEGDLMHGKNHLIVNVAEKMLEQLFDKEILWLHEGELIIKTLEKKYKHSLDAQGISGIEKMTFSGTIDRVDSKGGILRILDYKTGYVNAKKLAPDSWDDIFTDPAYSRAFQLMMYAWLYMNNESVTEGLQAGILSLRMPGNGPAMFIPPGNSILNNDSLTAFESGLAGMMNEMFNPEIPFMQTDDEARCKFCPFQEICNRLNTANDNW